MLKIRSGSNNLNNINVNLGISVLGTLFRFHYSIVQTITITNLCNIRLFFTPVKHDFELKNVDIFLIFAKHILRIADTRKSRLTRAVLTSTHKLCFRAKIRKSCVYETPWSAMNIMPFH